MALLPEELIPTRATLIERLKDWQDHSSWQVFFDTYANLIYGVAIRGGLTRLEAQDVVQETMLAVARNMPTFKYDPALGSFKYWLLNMTRWRIRDQFRKRLPVEEDQETAASQTATDADGDEAEGEEAIPTSSDLDKIWDAEWENNLLEAAITKAKRHLDPQQYQIFDFCVNKEWPPEKVAVIFSIPVGQVYMAKHRVAEKIKLEVERLKAEVV